MELLTHEPCSLRASCYELTISAAPSLPNRPVAISVERKTKVGKILRHDKSQTVSSNRGLKEDVMSPKKSKRPSMPYSFYDKVEM